MSLVGILMIIIGAGSLAVIVLSVAVKHLREDKKKLERRLFSMNKNIAQLKTGFAKDADAVTVQGQIDHFIKGAASDEDAKAVRDRIVNRITDGLLNL